MPCGGSPIMDDCSCAAWTRRGFAVMMAAALCGCSGTGGFNPGDFLSSAQPASAPQAPPPTSAAGGVGVGLLLPMSAGGNAGAAGQAMRNAAEMAVAEFNGSNLRLLARTMPAPRQALRPPPGRRPTKAPRFFSVRCSPIRSPVRRASGAQPRGAHHRLLDRHQCGGSRRLSPELPAGTDVDRVITYAASQGKRSFIGLVPSNAYGSVVEARSSRRWRGGAAGSRHRALRRGTQQDRRGGARAGRRAATSADALFMADTGEPVGDAVTAFVPPASTCTT